jgi:staphylococcal nuclease domain-containing protein 1
VSIIGNKAPHNIEELEDAEYKAKEEGLGIWNKQQKIIQEGGSKKVKQNERIPVMMTDITDASRFYVRLQNDNQYDKIEKEMAKIDFALEDDLEKPVKKGTICAARFKLDNHWYRSRVLRSLAKGQHEVQFIDFGNVDVANSEDLKKLPSALL